MLNRKQTLDLFKSNIHCSQIVLGEFAEELGYDVEEAYRMANALAGGSFLGNTCGCVTGAMLAIGLKYGNGEIGNVMQDNICKEKALRFQQEFKERRGSLICRELLGYDMSKPEEAAEAFASGKIFGLCPDLVLETIDILKKIFAED